MMKIHSSYLRRLARRFTAATWTALAFGTALGVPGGAAAEEPRWYQVELIIFAQRLPENAPQEIWPRDIPLAYPPNWVELKDPDAPLAALVSSSATPDTAAPLPTPADLAREPYYKLPAAELELAPQARDLRRDGRYRVLFHQAWRQPMIGIRKSPAILIQGGNSYDEHTELEGSINISIARYLHLHTNLWLSEFSANYGQEAGGWPDLPRRPSVRQADPALALGTDKTAADWWDNRLNPAGEYESILANRYLVNKVVTFRQKRGRIRSGEVHYLDHPLMGLLIKMKPYEVPEVEPAPENVPNSGSAAGVEATPAVPQ
ncbi:hypothetical protein FKG94_09690 [Exilibacterium tricleocarpae]|uniref:Peptidoglycan-binding protein n=1 Tax=Exilibacterium tricleocarpae TaxID=2591008 RepID=A0A545TVW7_9GAMM|nr:CsiV family protein [Exilibacterium tricleocarpae]TQV81353.1 hypothetical protein FKG94_09690 [Exilibacterium tricleocarpae]